MAKDDLVSLMKRKNNQVAGNTSSVSHTTSASFQSRSFYQTRLSEKIDFGINTASGAHSVTSVFVENRNDFVEETKDIPTKSQFYWKNSDFQAEYKTESEDLEILLGKRLKSSDNKPINLQQQVLMTGIKRIFMQTSSYILEYQYSGQFARSIKTQNVRISAEESSNGSQGFTLNEVISLVKKTIEEKSYFGSTSKG